MRKILSSQNSEHNHCISYCKSNKITNHLPLVDHTSCQKHTFRTKCNLCHNIIFSSSALTKHQHLQNCIPKHWSIYFSCLRSLVGSSILFWCMISTPPISIVLTQGVGVPNVFHVTHNLANNSFRCTLQHSLHQHRIPTHFHNIILDNRNRP